MQAREGFEPSSGEDERWMREALRAAREAAERGEVPVGACVVSADGAPLSAAGNRTAKRRIVMRTYKKSARP